MKSKTSVEQQIKMYNMMKTDNAYYLKGKALMELAEITGEKGHVKEAIEAYSEAIKLKQDSTYLCERAKAYSQIGLSKEAVMDFKLAWSILSNDVSIDVLKRFHVQSMLEDLMKLDYIQESLLNQKMEEEKIEKPFIGDVNKEEVNKSEQEVLNIINHIKMYNQLPDNDNSNYLKGKEYVKLGKILDPITNYELAIESFSKAILLSKTDNPSYFYERGNAYKLLNSMEKASEDINIAKSLLSKTTGLHYIDLSNKLGGIVEHPNKSIEIEKYNKILEKNPDNGKVHNLKGLALKDSGMYNEAIESFSKAIELLPSDANYYVHRGEVLYLLNKKSATDQDYAMAEKLLQENKSDYDEFSTMRLKDKINDYKHNYQENKIGDVQYLLQESINEQQHIQSNLVDMLNVVNTRTNELEGLYSIALQSLAQHGGDVGVVYDLIDDLKVAGDLGHNNHEDDSI